MLAIAVLQVAVGGLLVGGDRKPLSPQLYLSCAEKVLGSGKVGSEAEGLLSHHDCFASFQRKRGFFLTQAKEH